MSKKYQVKLLRKEKIAKDTWLFAFSARGRFASGGEEIIKFVPGQYMTYLLTLPNGKTDWRDMTITSQPSHHELWLVTKIKKDPSQFKQTLLNIPIGSLISLEGPSGGFTIEKEKGPLVFLAGGIGVNVFHSILQHAAEKKLDTVMTLIVSFSNKDEIIFSDELKKIENKNIKVVYSLTRISERLLKQHLSSILDKVFMIAGPQDFVDLMNGLLLQMGVPRGNIRIDYFTGY